MGENSKYSNFMMLTEHLYEIFARYIVHGRTRAPPEVELIEMLPTFQLGSKTDRRALQSKFKSWAKRLNFENGYLVLMTSGKIVVPKERCDNLVMYLHSEEHQNIDDVISAIRRKYTWTKKNFGMDRDVVVESILRNCKREDCLKRMRMEKARFGTSFSMSAPSSEMKDFFPFAVPPPLPCISPYSWPLPFSVPPMFPLNSFPFQIPVFSNVLLDTGNSRVVRNEVKNISRANPASGLNSNANHKKREATSNSSAKTVEKSNSKSPKTEEIPLSVGEISRGNPNAADDAIVEMSTLAFKKPKNCREYELLMEAVRQRPSEFPKILGKEKNRFLSILGLAPKKICSSKTLKKFRREHRQKQLMNRACVVYRERKTLRDKNKLKKFLCGKTHTFLGISKRKDVLQTRHDGLTSSTLKTSKMSRFLKVFRKVKDVKYPETGSKRKRAKLHRVAKKGTFEVIDIASSSDDEIGKMNDSSVEANGFDKHENVSVVTSKNPVISASRNLVESDKISEEKAKNENLRHDGTAENIPDKPLSLLKQPTNEQGGIVKSHTILPQNKEPVLFIHESSSRFSEIKPPRIKPKMYPITKLKDSTSNLTTSAVRPEIPSKPHVTTSQNIPRTISLLPASQLANGKVFLIDKGNNETFYVIPRYILPEDLQKLGNKLPSNSPQARTVINATLPLLQPKPTNVETYEGKSFPSEKMPGEDMPKIDFNQEMTKISTWIYRMKASLNPNMFHNNIESSVRKLVSQLDMGLFLVKKAKKSLVEIENSIGIQKPFTKEIR